MKIDCSDKAQIAEARSRVTETADLKKFDAFLADVKVFDFDNEDHVAKARACCTNCCSNVVIGFQFYN